jgi:hypothetical protein
MGSTEFAGRHDPDQGDRDEIEDKDEDESPEITSRSVEDHPAHIGAQSRTYSEDAFKGSIDPSEISSCLEVG